METITHTPDIIERPRLLQKLEKIPDHRLTLISAPPGYGKTTLARQFAQHSAYPVAWLTIERRDLISVHRQNLEALEPLVPGIRAIVVPRGYNPIELAGLTADFLSKASSGQMIYILDDIHLLIGTSAEAWLYGLVNTLPSSVHLVFISRVVPDLPLDLVTRRKLLLVDTADLRLTLDEIRRLAASIPNVTLDLQDLETKLEGWPVGTTLALFPLQQDLERVILRGNSGTEALFNVLAEAMLAEQPSELRKFLLHSSTLERLSPRYCSDILQLKNSAELLAQVRRQNLFLTPIAGGLVFHSLFRTFLQSKFKVTQPAEFRRLHERAAVYSEAHEAINEAITHYLEADLTERAAALADRVAGEYFMEGCHETLHDWITVLKEVAQRPPYLLFNCAIIDTDRGDFDTAVALLDEASQTFVEHADQGGLQGANVQRLVIELHRGNYQVVIERANSLVEQTASWPQLQGRVYNIWGKALLHLGHASEAVSVLEQALPLYRQYVEAYGLSMLLQDLSVAYSKAGRYRDAFSYLQETVALRRTLGSPRALALALNNLGSYYHRGSDYQQAEIVLQEGLELVASKSDRRVEFLLNWSLGDVKRDLGQRAIAWECFERALDLIGDTEPVYRCSILLSMAVLRRWQGHQQSERLAAEALDLATHHHMRVQAALAAAALWACRLTTPAQALNVLEKSFLDLQEAGSIYELLRVGAICAKVALDAGERELADRYFRQALDYANQLGTAQALAAEVSHTEALHRLIKPAFNEHAILIQDLKTLSASQQQATSTDPVMYSSVAPAVYALQFFTLGQETVIHDGHITRITDWRTTAARQLLFSLLFLGPRNREQICAELWPDASPEKARSIFHLSLSRSRQAVGDLTLIVEDGLYRINPGIDVWCDADELQHLTHKARRFSSHDVRAEDLSRRAIDLYDGDFLPSLDADWIVFRREHLRECYLEALIRFADCAYSRNDYPEAIDRYRHVLDEEPFREDMHRQLLKCYSKRGDKHKITSHLEYLRQLLERELATEPSRETLALVQSLLE